MTAKNIWLAENVLEILTEQRYGAREALAEAGAIRRAAAACYVAESAPQLPARRVCHPAPCTRGRFGSSTCSASSSGSALMGFSVRNTPAFP